MAVRSLPGLLLVAAACAACAQDRQVVRGELSWTDGHFAKVSECGTDRVYVFGVMASAPYFILSRRYDELSGEGKKPVLIEVEGSVAPPTSSTGGNPTLDQPQVIALSAGACGAAR